MSRICSAMATVRWAMDEMQPLDHAPFNHDHALTGVLRLAEGVDHFPRPIDLLLGRGEDLVAGGNLARMDQGLAIHAQRPPAFALLAQAKLVAEIVIDPVDDVEAVRARPAPTASR